MGMFFALQKKAPNATVSFLSSKMRAQKNRTVDNYLDNMDQDKQNQVIRFAVKYGRKQRDEKRVKQSEVRAELSKRIATKRQQKETKQRKHLQKKLKTADLSVVTEEHHLGTAKQGDLADIMEGKIIGRTICHIWSENEGHIVYNGRVDKFHGKSGVYVVAYWSHDESYTDAVDYNMPMHELAMDLIYDDLVLCC